jgi:hypothetical protein
MENKLFAAIAPWPYLGAYHHNSGFSIHAKTSIQILKTLELIFQKQKLLFASKTSLSNNATNCSTISTVMSATSSSSFVTTIGNSVDIADNPALNYSLCKVQRIAFVF